MTTSTAKAPMRGGPCDGDQYDGPTFPMVLTLDCPIIGKRTPSRGRYRYDFMPNGEYLFMGQVR